PNHMGVAGPANRWWDDVLLRGADSPHAQVFDIDWDADPERRLRLPILGESVEDAGEAGHFALLRDDDAGWRLRYHDHDLPLTAAGIDALAAATGAPARPGVLRDGAA